MRGGDGKPEDRHARPAGGPGPVTAWDCASAGTYVDRRLPGAGVAAVLAVALALVLAPSVGMIWFRADSTTENRELAPVPSLFEEDGSWNLDILSDLGGYFEDHFAFRNQLVAMNAAARAALGSSATDQVVVGTDGWLYYGGTLPDYLGQNRLSDRELRSIAHNLALAQGYVEGLGARFAFAVAPNKNALYPGHMPYYYLASEGPSNWERLVPYLDEAGVDYVDWKRLFAGDSGVWYLKTDSHWDNRGALMAANELLSATGRRGLLLDVGSATARADFMGDLESMLMPFGAQPEVNYYYAGYNENEGGYAETDAPDLKWDFTEGSERAVTASWTQAESDAGQGSLLMFRDSFGNALLPYLASSFERSAFSKMVPYNLPTAAQLSADTVVIERAERHLGYLAETPPIMASPDVTSAWELPVADMDGRAGDVALSVTTDGPYWVLSGTVEPEGEDRPVFVSVQPAGGEEVLYDPFWVNGPEDVAAGGNGGFRAYLRADDVDVRGAAIRVYERRDDTLCLIETLQDVQPDGAALGE